MELALKSIGPFWVHGTSGSFGDGKVTEPLSTSVSSDAVPEPLKRLSPSL
jgi:hypothetical protein